MHRFRSFLLATLALASSGVLAAASGCDSGLDPTTGTDAGTPRKDSSAVDPAEAGAALGEDSPSVESCTKYCTLVMGSCTGDDAQYASTEECLAFCGHLPPDPVAAASNSRGSPSLACRQYWADSPARTNPRSSCLAAGPFGGNVCGDRCTAFCDVLLDACGAETTNAVYGDQPDCASACAGFTYVDAGTDGGGEAPDGPDAGDSLNCRLYHLRAATLDATRCADLRAGGACAGR